MEPLAITTETRLETGKGAMRRLRARGLTPAVFYGPGTPQPLQLAVSPKALLHALATPYKRNQVIALEVGTERKLAMVRELQVHPLSRQIQHVDFYEVALDRTIDVKVPFAYEGRAKGVIAGGEITVVFRDLPLRATPDRVPALIKVDVTNMELGHVMRVKDLAMPDGVTVLLDPERSLVSCAEPRKRPTEEEEAAAAAAATGAAPAAAPTGTTTPPPAAGGKAAPAAKPAGKGKG
jgi:large subunit ribosomal protein L25